MPRITVESPHSLGLPEALQRLKERFRVARDTFGQHATDLSEVWQGNSLLFSFKTMGMKVAGTVAVEPDHVRLAVDLPLAAMMFKKTIQERIGTELAQILAPA
jgi:hypothetical protein